GGDYKVQQRAIPEKASFRQAFAHYLAKDGANKLAEQEAAFAFELAPTARNARVHLNRLWQNKNFADSLTACKEYQRQFPEDQWILRRYAEIFIQLKQYDQAISLYRQLIGMSSASKKNIINYFVRIAGLYARQKLYVDAVAVLKEGITQYPRTGKLYHVLGVYFRRMDKNEEALHAFKKAVSLNPDNVGFRYQLGLEYRRHKLEQEALSEWKECLDIRPHFTRCRTGIEQIRKQFGLSDSGQ
ncbi:MAG: tetratricopeptide repeat protein, partial [Candidatus Electrothrix sp. MAN1_4]|nr:tetratricopeptide repeat protein [Candidatus Electrothrix sp. MAN1_4]